MPTLRGGCLRVDDVSAIFSRLSSSVRYFLKTNVARASITAAATEDMTTCGTEGTIRASVILDGLPHALKQFMTE